MKLRRKLTEPHYHRPLMAVRNKRSERRFLHIKKDKPVNDNLAQVKICVDICTPCSVDLIRSDFDLGQSGRSVDAITTGSAQNQRKDIASSDESACSPKQIICKSCSVQVKDIYRSMDRPQKKCGNSKMKRPYNMSSCCEESGQNKPGSKRATRMREPNSDRSGNRDIGDDTGRLPKTDKRSLDESEILIEDGRELKAAENMRCSSNSLISSASDQCGLHACKPCSVQIAKIDSANKRNTPRCDARNGDGAQADSSLAETKQIQQSSTKSMLTQYPCRPCSVSVQPLDLKKDVSPTDVSRSIEGRKVLPMHQIMDLVSSPDDCDTDSDVSSTTDIDYGMDSSTDDCYSGMDSSSTDEEGARLTSLRRRKLEGKSQRRRIVKNTSNRREDHRLKTTEKIGSKDTGQSAMTPKKSGGKSEKRFTCPYCVKYSFPYKFLNNMISHIYAKHKEITNEEVKEIVDIHMGKKQ